MSINKVILVGNVGKQPEVRSLNSGDKVANFSLATSESYKKDGEKVTLTEWHNITIFGKLAEIVEMFVNKGDLLYIEGAIRTRSYDDKEGNKRYTTEIVLNGFNSTLKMLGGKKEVSTGSQQQDNTPTLGDDDLPF